MRMGLRSGLPELYGRPSGQIDQQIGYITPNGDSGFETLERMETRRRPMNVKVGATVWIYAKRPVGSIVGCAKVRDIHLLAPQALWRRFCNDCCIPRSEFFEYFEGVAQATALELSGCKRLGASLSLESLRRSSVGFQPPQFFARLKVGTPLMGAICNAG
jgi:predicted transcriptional regulator